MGVAPVVPDGDLVLGESGAIVEYTLAKYGPGGLTRGPADPDFVHYLYWLHFANGTLHPTRGRTMILHRLDVPGQQPMASAMRARLAVVLSPLEARCAQAPYRVGADLSAADIMSVFSLTTMRSFYPLELAPYPQIRADLQQRIGVRDAYRRAMQKGDPEMAPMLGQAPLLPAVVPLRPAPLGQAMLGEHAAALQAQTRQVARRCQEAESVVAIDGAIDGEKLFLGHRWG